MTATKFTTCDLCDANISKLSDESLTVLQPVFKHFGKAVQFYGPAFTVKVFEDNVLVRATLEQAGHGQVLVVDGGASLRCALVGGMLGVLAQKNNWAGIIVNGCIRDSVELNECHIGVRALALHPQRSQRKGEGEQQCSVFFAGATIKPGDFIYADEDGILVSHDALI